MVDDSGEELGHEQLVLKEQQFFYKVTEVNMAANGWDGVNVCVPSTVSLRQRLQLRSV